MKEIYINYTENMELWKMARMAKENGYKQTNDAYWSQIFENENGDTIILSREEYAEVNPIEALEAFLNGEELQTEEVNYDIYAELVNTAEEIPNATRYNMVSYCIGRWGKIDITLYDLINKLYADGFVKD